MPGRREFLCAAGAAAVAAALPRRVRAGSAPRTVRVGAVLPFSGGLEALGHQARFGIELALTELNAGGGILGTQVELVYQDDRSDALTAVQRTTQLLERDDAIAVIGALAPGALEAMMPVHRRMRTPLLHAAHHASAGCERYLFAFGTLPSQEVETLVPELMARAGASFHLLGTESAWSRAVLAHAATLVRRLGGAIVGTELVAELDAQGGSDPAEVLRRVRDGGAQVLLVALPGADAVAFLAQATSGALPGTVAIGCAGFSEAWLAAVGAGAGARTGAGAGAASGTLQAVWAAVTFAASIDDLAVADFVARVRRIAGNDVAISHHVMTHYNALKALELAARNAGTATREAVVDALEGATLATPTGTMRIRRDDHRATQPMFLARVENGRLAVVKPMGAAEPREACARLSDR